MRPAHFTLIVCALAFAAEAQFPGQYPPGQYPPGQYPPGQGRGRYPNNDPANNPQRGRQQKQGRNAKDPVTVITTSGMLRRAVGSQFVLEADDHRIITYRMYSKTTVQKDGKDADITAFAAGDRLVVDSSEDDQGYFTAVSVRFDKVATPADRAAASIEWDLPKLDGKAAASASAPSTPPREPGDERPVLRRKGEDPAPKETAANDTAVHDPSKADASKKVEVAKVEPEEPIDTRPTTTLRPADPKADDDDPGPPSLRRGAPAPRRPVTRTAASSGGESSGGPVLLSKPAEPTAVAPQPASILTQSQQDDPIIQKAREAAFQYSGMLPNFFCQQMTTRYQSDHPKTGWDPLDVVTADVAYENGKESYKNIKVGNKAVNKPMEDIEGTRSTGEFSTILEELLNPATGAVFRRSGQDTIHGRSTYVFKFEVPRERSRWRIEAPSQLYHPAYQGTIWIDKETSRLLRIEQQTRNMPLLFPFDTVETATDYDFVRLAAPDPFLLPVDAEVLSCLRGTSTCTRNRIEFRNYRKFGAESSITFDGKIQQ